MTSHGLISYYIDNSKSFMIMDDSFPPTLGFCSSSDIMCTGSTVN